MATSGSFISTKVKYTGTTSQGGTYYLWTKFRFDWEVVSTNQATMESVISWTTTTIITFDEAGNNPAGSGYQRSLFAGSYVTIDGQKVSTPSKYYVSNNERVQQGQTTIAYNQDGTKDFDVTFGYKVGKDSVTCSGTETFTLDAMALKPMIGFKVNGTWKYGYPYIKVNGVWKQATEVYIKNNGVWKPTSVRG